LSSVSRRGGGKQHRHPWRLRWSLWGPVRVPEASFTRRDVRLAALPVVVARAERAPIEDAEVTSAVIERAIPFEPGVRFLVNIRGTREDAQLRADSRGQVTEILR
jgi:hypothetical protein